MAPARAPDFEQPYEIHTFGAKGRDRAVTM